MRRYEAFAQAVAKTRFRDFQDPAARGPNFSWDRFPELVGGMAEAELWMHYNRRPKDFEALGKETKHLTMQHAQALVDDARTRGECL